ncbi:MAG TPA: thrombospondin type-1 domain-containing protein [Terriglobales bacterium]|nr:thrombospondin type-1 domain-containing protein [Terriglobales bacterium]
MQRISIIGGIAALASVLATAATPAAAVTIFGDRFERADGALGSSWSSTNGLGLPPATIVSGEACADDHGIATVAAPLTATNVQTSFTFHAPASENFEVYALAFDGDGGLYVAGCAGSNGSNCTPKIEKLGGAKVEGTDVPLTANTPYELIAGFHADGAITLSLRTAGGTELAALNASTSGNFAELGVLIGRESDSNLTCVNDFKIEDLDDTVRFSDDFARADGAIGANWSGIGLPELTIAAQQACGTRPASGGNGALDAWVEEVSAEASIAMEVDFTNVVADDHHAALIMAQLSSKYALFSIEDDGGGLHLSVATGVPGSAPTFECSPSATFSLASNTSYRLTAQRDPDGTSIATLREASSSTIIAQVDCNTGAGNLYDTVLLSAGGHIADGTTCTDNFVLYAAEPVEGVDCVVSGWSGFGSCSASCGGGTQIRTRTILTPASGGGEACPELSESQPCNTDPCASGGFVPSNKGVLKCEQGLVKNVAKRLACQAKCDSKEAADSSYDEVDCSATCQLKFDGSKEKSIAKATCPACLDSVAEHDAVMVPALASLSSLSASVYCQAGAIDGALGCEQKLGKALIKLGQCQDKCHSKLVGALLKVKPFDESLCQIGCRAKFDKLAGKLASAGGCPSCLGASQQSDLAAQVEATRQRGNAAFYCEGSTPIP